MLIFSCLWQRYRHFSPGQNTLGLCDTFLAMPDLETAIIMTVQAEADRSWQLMGSKHSFPSLWILNIQGRYALKSQSRPQICWITLIQLQSIVSPWQFFIDSWLLSQSFHVMIDTSQPFGGFWQLLEEAYAEGAQPCLKMAQWYQSVLVRAPWGPSSYV